MSRLFSILRRLPLLPGRQDGFTLVELLVVVGIIVALAAVIIPNVTGFAGKGAQGASDSENENIQTAIDNYMTDQGLTALPVGDFPAALASGDSDWSSTGTLNLFTGSYLRQSSSAYLYCWDATGLVLTQSAATVADGGTLTC